MAQLLGVLEQGLIYAVLALGVYITFKILDFPDMTVDSSFPLGAAVTALMISNGVNPLLTLPASLLAGAAAGALTEPDIVATSMRVAPGVTLWGPVAAPEQAELMARPVELLLDVLRRESDVVFIDTSVFWGDAVAAAVAASDRCLIVGDAAVSSATSASRVIELASRVGVPRTRMSAVFNRFGARGADEDVAMRFEIACALSSKIRIADGGQDLAALMAFGRADEAVGQTSAFATSVREATREMLVELGCAVGPWSDMVADRATRTERPRIRLPWSREGDQR